MHFALIGINHENADLSIREQVVFTDTKKMEMYLIMVQENIRESVILSTCNRSEIYFLYEEKSQVEKAMKAFVSFFPQVNIAKYLVIKQDEEALSYLFAVCNGLHSLVLGEDQILGQVVRAEEFSRINGCSKKVMNKIFRDAVTCAKKAKTKYRISEHPLSLSYIGIQKLIETCGIKDKTVMVLGSGKMSTLTMNYLFDKKAKCVYNANRNIENAKLLKQRYSSLIIVPFKNRYDYIGKCDIIISATASPHIIIKAEKMPELYQDLYIVDLATPRDIDPILKDNKFIHLYDMDELQKTANINNKQRKTKTLEIKKMIDTDVANTIQWIRATRVDDTIQTLQERISQISNDAYQLLNHKLSLNDHERYILKKTLETSMQRLMRDPIITLKKAESEKQETYQEVMKDLFHLKSKEEDDAY